MSTTPENSMMSPAIEKLMNRTQSKFSLVTLAAKRAREITEYFGNSANRQCRWPNGRVGEH